MSLTPTCLQDRISLLIVLSALLLPLSLAPAWLAASTVNSASSNASPDGWVQLFDGESTAAWRGYRKDVFPSNGWQVEDGWLQVMEGGGGGDLVTLQQYDDFELEMEWKAPAGSNSGIMYLANENNGAPYFSAPEYQLFGDEDLTSTSNTSSGGLYGLYSPENKKLNSAGEVNHARIVHCAGNVEHWVNGVMVLRAKIGSVDWDKRVAGSKFNAWTDFGTVKKGHIVLQDHGNDVWFRSIRVREIPKAQRWRYDGDFVQMFNGYDMAGWSAHLNNDAKMEDVWSVAGGVLSCKGNPAGYIYTDQKYQNFVVELDWRWDPATKKGGNSGVLFRQVGDHKVWPKSIEAQLMSGSAGDFWCIGDFPMKTDPKRTRGRNTKHMEMNENEVGEWNHYEIHCIGSDVILMVNGKVVNSASDCAEVAGPVCLQSEGTAIQFKNIRLFPMAGTSQDATGQ
ncbi:MAG: DUF1080 domain-containing protein [Planctomycetota bacterium]|nr:DUF1080 domain-containing protein [Planctomycetota bacterium]